MSENFLAAFHNVEWAGSALGVYNGSHILQNIFVLCREEFLMAMFAKAAYSYIGVHIQTSKKALKPFFGPFADSTQRPMVLLYLTACKICGFTITMERLLTKVNKIG